MNELKAWDDRAFVWPCAPSYGPPARGQQTQACRTFEAPPECVNGNGCGEDSEGEEDVGAVGVPPHPCLGRRCFFLSGIPALY